MNKGKLLWAIAKNFGRLASGDFWWQALTVKDHPTWVFVKMIFVGAAKDIWLMLVKPGYPEVEADDE